MSEWKSGDLPEQDGFYWLWTGRVVGLVLRQRCQDPEFYTMEFVYGMNAEIDPDAALWQGPLTPPDPPEK